jgi:hypothetical protein
MLEKEIMLITGVIIGKSNFLFARMEVFLQVK